MTMLVLSPSVEAMKTSARSIPAACSASVSSPAPTVNWPPRSSQLFSSPTSSRACDSGSSSRQETSWPSRSIARATEEPTRPQPTIKISMARILVRVWPAHIGVLGRSRAEHASLPASLICLTTHALGSFRGCREQNSAGRFLQHVLGGGTDLGRLGGTDAADLGAAADLRRRLAADHDRLRAAAPGRLEDAGADLAGADHLGADADVLVPLAALAGAVQRPPRLVLALGRQRCVQRQGQRHFDHVDELEVGVFLVPAGLGLLS